MTMFNISLENRTVHYCVNSCIKEPTGRLKSIYLASNACIDVAGMAINAIITYIYYQNKQLRTKANLIIIAMATASILVAVSEIACSITHVTNPTQYPSKHWVTAQKCIDTVLSSYIIQAIALLSIQRQLIVTYIQRPNVKTNLRRMKLTLFAMGIVTAAISIPLIVLSNTIRLNITLYTSSHTIVIEIKQYYYYRILHAALFSFAPLCITTGSYCYIAHKIRRKSRTLHKKIERGTINKGALKRADMQTTLGVIAILVFITIFYFSKEVMTVLIIAQGKLVPQRWLYISSILMSNIFQQFAPLIHVCTSTRYRAKLRQSLTRTDLSTHTNASGTMTKWHPLNILERTKLTALDNQQTGICHIVLSANRDSKKCRSMLVLNMMYDTINDNSEKNCSSVQYRTEKETVISTCAQMSGKSTDAVRSKRVDVQCNKHGYGAIGRRHTDSELQIKKFNLLKSGGSLANCKKCSDKFHYSNSCPEVNCNQTLYLLSHKLKLT